MDLLTGRSGAVVRSKESLHHRDHRAPQRTASSARVAKRCIVIKRMEVPRYDRPVDACGPGGSFTRMIRHAQAH
jgi:hypothetical protein